MGNDYSFLLNKKIRILFEKTCINAYIITKINPTDRFMVGLEGNGRIYNCNVKWQKPSGTPPFMDFDEQTLNALLHTGECVCPTLSSLKFKLESTLNSQVN